MPGREVGGTFSDYDMGTGASYRDKRQEGKGRTGDLLEVPACRTWGMTHPFDILTCQPGQQVEFGHTALPLMGLRTMLSQLAFTATLLQTCPTPIITDACPHACLPRITPTLLTSSNDRCCSGVPTVYGL